MCHPGWLQRCDGVSSVFLSLVCIRMCCCSSHECALFCQNPWSFWSVNKALSSFRLVLFQLWDWFDEETDFSYSVLPRGRCGNLACRFGKTGVRAKVCVRFQISQSASQPLGKFESYLYCFLKRDPSKFLPFRLPDTAECYVGVLLLLSGAFQWWCTYVRISHCRHEWWRFFFIKFWSTVTRIRHTCRLDWNIMVLYKLILTWSCLWTRICTNHSFGHSCTGEQCCGHWSLGLVYSWRGWGICTGTLQVPHLKSEMGVVSVFYVVSGSSLCAYMWYKNCWDSFICLVTCAGQLPWSLRPHSLVGGQVGRWGTLTGTTWHIVTWLLLRCHQVWVSCLWRRKLQCMTV